jgi:hypothetical protein
MTRDELLGKWRAEAETMRRRGVLADGAALCDEILRDVEGVLRSEEEQLLTLEQAAERSGYSVEHLGRMVREGRIRNAGRKGSPRIRAGDLPRRPKSIPATGSASDRVAIARAIVARKPNRRA